MTNPGSFQKDAHAFRLQTHTQGPWGWVCGIQLIPPPSSASLCTLPVQHLPWEARPSVTKMNGEVVWGLVGHRAVQVATGRVGQAQRDAAAQQDRPQHTAVALSKMWQILRAEREFTPLSQLKKKEKEESGCGDPTSLCTPGNPSRAGSRARRRVVNCLRCSFLMFASEYSQLFLPAYSFHLGI